MSKIFRSLVKIDFILFIREKANIIYIIVLPLILLFIFGLIFSHPLQDRKMVIIDKDATKTSQKLVQYIRDSQVYKLEVKPSGFEASKTAQSDDTVILIIPEKFESMILEGKSVRMDVYINTREDQKSAISKSILKYIQPGINSNLMGYKDIVSFNYHNSGKGFYSNLEFLIPGLIIMVILSLGLYNIGLKLTIFRQFNQLKMFYTLPVKHHVFLFVQMVSNFSIIIFQTLGLLILSAILFDVRMPAQSGLFIWSVLISSLTFLSLGFFLASIFKNYKDVMTVINIIYFPMLIFSGIYFSTDIFPSLFKFIKYLFPAWYCVDLIRSSFLGIFDLNSFILNNAVCFAMIIAAVAVSIKKFRWY